MQAYAIRARGIASVEVPVRLQVTLYDNAALDGNHIELTGENEDLQGNGWDNRTRALRIEVVK